MVRFALWWSSWELCQEPSAFDKTSGIEAIEEAETSTSENIADDGIISEHYLNRSYKRQSTVTKINNEAQKVDGKFKDPNTKEPIEGDYHIGHKTGYEYWKFRNWAESQGMTQAQFNDIMNDPDIYQIEDAMNNMSHIFEAPDDIFFGGDWCIKK
jgi:hypothetical protein